MQYQTHVKHLKFGAETFHELVRVNCALTNKMSVPELAQEVICLDWHCSQLDAQNMVGKVADLAWEAGDCPAAQIGPPVHGTWRLPRWAPGTRPPLLRAFLSGALPLAATILPPPLTEPACTMCSGSCHKCPSHKECTMTCKPEHCSKKRSIRLK